MKIKFNGKKSYSGTGKSSFEKKEGKEMSKIKK